MSNPTVPGSSADVNVQVRALGTDPNVSVQYKTVILKKNLVNGVNTLTQAMMNQTNTKYVIKYDYTLGEDITVPSGCILEFDGGSISVSDSNDTITGTNTGINARLVKILDTNVTLVGTWTVAEAYPEWFGAVGGNDNDDTISLQKALTFGEIGPKVILSKNHKITSSLHMTHSKLDGRNFVINSQATDKAIILDGNNWGLIIENLTLTSQNKVTDYGIYSNEDTVSQSLINNVRVSNFKEAGIYIDRAWYVNLQNIRIEQCTNYGLYVNQAYSSKLHNIDSVINGINIHLGGSSCNIQNIDITGATNKGLEINGCNASCINNIYCEVWNPNTIVFDFTAQILGFQINGAYITNDNNSGTKIFKFIDDYNRGVVLGGFKIDSSVDVDIFAFQNNSSSSYIDRSYITLLSRFEGSTGYHKYSGYGAYVVLNDFDNNHGYSTITISNGTPALHSVFGSTSYDVKSKIKNNIGSSSGYGHIEAILIDSNFGTFKGFVEILTNKGTAKYYADGTQTENVITLLETSNASVFNDTETGIHLVAYGKNSFIIWSPVGMTTSDLYIYRVYKV